MIWNQALLALACVAGLSLLSALWRPHQLQGRESQGLLHEYLLANQSLRRSNIVDLLLSTSFSLNGMLYQIWLGYLIGIWALVVQGVWALSYVLLARHVQVIRQSKSLHGFLGDHFGPQTRVLAGICSIVGFTVLLGWEFSVGRSTFEGLLNFEQPKGSQTGPALWLTMATVLSCFIYTAIGGLRSNALANKAQNLLKIAVYLWLITLLAYAVLGTEWRSILWAFLVSPMKAVESLGYLGLITNIAFSLVWQFVDMSTWQSVTASTQGETEDQTRKGLIEAGIAVFFAPGIVGTCLGVLLNHEPGVTSDNVMAKVVAVLPQESTFWMFVVFAALIASIMSMIDGLMLASAYSLVTDILHPKESLQDLDSDPARAERMLALLRVFLALLAVAGTWGVVWLLDVLKIGLFDIVYVLIVCQLSLTGPVLAGLWGREATGPMVWAIVAGLVVGFATVIGRVAMPQLAGVVEGAGLWTIIASVAVALRLSRVRSLPR